MKKLQEKILTDGLALGTEVIKVDSFINHQIDTAFMMEMGQEFYREFHSLHPTKILTIESSGIPAAVATAVCFGNIPVVFAKKAAPNTMVEEYYSAQVKSFTKGTVSTARVAKKYLSPQDKVLIIDDFLAHGEAASGLCEILSQAKAEILGIGVIIEKCFQHGRQKLAKYGCPVKALAMVEKIEDGHITFRED